MGEGGKEESDYIKEEKSPLFLPYIYIYNEEKKKQIKKERCVGRLKSLI